MGACGCGSAGPDQRLALEGGREVGVTVYPGCDDCVTPIGVQLDDLGWMHPDDVEHVPKFEVGEEGAVIVLVAPEHLVKVLQDVCELDVDHLDLSPRDVARAVRAAVHATRRDPIYAGCGG